MDARVRSSTFKEFNCLLPHTPLLIEFKQWVLIFFWIGVVSFRFVLSEALVLN
jgi:hypothetical protein